MKLPLIRPIPVWRGSETDVAVFVLRNPNGSLMDLTGHDFVFKAENQAGLEMVKSVSAGTLTLDLAKAELRVPMTSPETRAVPPGAETTYAIEWRYPNGAQKPFVVGLLVGKDYPNDD